MHFIGAKHINWRQYQSHGELVKLKNNIVEKYLCLFDAICFQCLA